VDLVTSFFDLLYSLRLRQGIKDKICWIHSKRRTFEVISFYHVLWLPFSLEKHLTTLGKILTLDNLRKRNIIVMEWCYMCKTCGESIDHLFLHYMVATELWSTILQLFDVVWVMPRSVIERCWQVGGDKGTTGCWCQFREWLHCVWCGVYERNEMGAVLKIMRLVLLTWRNWWYKPCFIWRVTLQFMSKCSYSDFLDLCSSFSLN